MKRMMALLSLVVLAACNTTIRKQNEANVGGTTEPAITPDATDRLDDFAQNQLTAEAKLADKGAVAIVDEAGKKVTNWQATLQNLRVTTFDQQELKLDWAAASKVVVVSPELDNGCVFTSPLGVTLAATSVKVSGFDKPADDQFSVDEKGLPIPVDNAVAECKEAMGSLLTETISLLLYNVPAMDKTKTNAYTVKLDLKH